MVNLTKEHLTPQESGVNHGATAPAEAALAAAPDTAPPPVDAGPGTLSRLYWLIDLAINLFQLFKWILSGTVALFAALGDLFSW